MKVLVFCSTSKPLISSYLGINAVYRNSFDSLPSELIVIAHDNDRLSGDRGNLWGGGSNPELRDACSLKQGQFRQYLYQARDLI